MTPIPPTLSRRTRALATAVIFCAALHTQANDSTARIGAGGIELLKTDDVRMLEEQLDISPQRVRVRYRFLNEGKSDLHTTVAFPMPAYRWNPGEAQTEVNVRPMRSFVAKIDGKIVSTQLSRSAMAGGKDITRELRAAGLSDTQIFDTFGDATVDGDGLTDNQRRRVLALVGGFPIPGWQVAETMHWEQTFPAGREIVVEHEYEPFVGMVYSAPVQRGFARSELDLRPVSLGSEARNLKEACLDDGIKQALDRRITDLAGAAPEVWVTLQDVEYVLGTGRNWRGPIDDFTLTIEKASADQLVSLCFPGKPTRVGGTSLQFRHRNFVPQDKLVVYFYTVKPGR